MDYLLQEKLLGLSTKLNTLFGDRYKKQQEELYKSFESPAYTYSSNPPPQAIIPSSQQTITHVHYDIMPSPYPSPIFWYYPPTSPGQTIIINNPNSDPRQEIVTQTVIKKKKEDEEKNNTTNQIISVGGGILLSFVATWVLAKDDYVNYGLSEIENDFYDLCKLDTKEYDFDRQLEGFKDNFYRWKNIYIAVTKPKFYGKATCITSGFAGLTGLFLGSTALMTGGVVGLTAGGCYLLWKHLTNKYHNESNEYHMMMTNLNNVINTLNSRRFAPSAPNF
jgi:hypothetical protein